MFVMWCCDNAVVNSYFCPRTIISAVQFAGADGKGSGKDIPVIKASNLSLLRNFLNGGNVGINS